MDLPAALSHAALSHACTVEQLDAENLGDAIRILLDGPAWYAYRGIEREDSARGAHRRLALALWLEAAAGAAMWWAFVPTAKVGRVRYLTPHASGAILLWSAVAVHRAGPDAFIHNLQPEWTRYPGDWRTPASAVRAHSPIVGNRDACTFVFEGVNPDMRRGPGWVVFLRRNHQEAAAEGPETGDAGQNAADAFLLNQRYALSRGDELLLPPLPPRRNGGEE